MTNENKLASMDAVGELPDFGNLLLRESGYPHLDDTPKQSQSDAWNEAGTKPDHPCLCEVKALTLSKKRHFQYFDGFRFGMISEYPDWAFRNGDIKSNYQNFEWREVQP